MNNGRLATSREVKKSERAMRATLVMPTSSKDAPAAHHQRFEVHSEEAK